MTRVPAVSVVLPTFNRAHLVGRALESVEAQTFRDIEIVVVDDGSTDDTRGVVELFGRAATLPLTYIHQPNRGCAAARNRGLRVARGSFLGFLDSDDAWLPNAVESLVDALVRSDADFAYSPAIESFADGSERVNHPVAAGHPEAFAEEHFQHTNLRNGAFMFRRSVLSTVPGLDESLRYNEDSDFIQRVAVRHRSVYCDRPTVRVYHHEGQKSRNRAEIYGALLTSAERILAENPEFGRQLGRAAETRLHELRMERARALLLAGRFEEAQETALHATPTVRLAVAMRSTAPLRVRAAVSRSIRHAGRHRG